VSPADVWTAIAAVLMVAGTWLVHGLLAAGEQIDEQLGYDEYIRACTPGDGQ